MDPITQSVLGAIAAQTVSKPKDVKIATLLGILGGMAPDLDVFIRSQTDPLLFLEFHRQFTHSLFFIPFGGIIIAIVLYYLGAKKKLNFRQTILFTTVGYATHALLDACTSYGTLLFWPFSYERIAWSTMSIIDPLFTLPLLAFVILFMLKASKPTLRWLAPVYCLLFLSLGWIQHDRAEQAANDLAKSRGHTTHTHVKPTLGNLLLWKSIYQWNGRYYVDAIRASYQIKIFSGESIPKLDWHRIKYCTPVGSRQYNDIQRFNWFSQGYLAQEKHNPNTIIDLRYSILPNSIKPLWGIKINCITPNTHVEYFSSPKPTKHTTAQFLNMLLSPTD